MQKCLKLTMRAHHEKDYEKADEAREQVHKENKPIVCLGPPGTGKTSVVGRAVRQALKDGARVLFANPTARLSSRMRARFPDADVDTCHAAFRLDADIDESVPLMAPYDFVVIDEISLLTQAQFERIMRLWQAADRVPTLVFLGDKFQLPGMGNFRPWHSAAWSKGHLRFVHLYEPKRCTDFEHNKLLQALRTDTPTKESRLVERICRGHKAWHGKDPDVNDVKRLLRKHPNAAMVTCTRRSAEILNNLAIEALHPVKKPLVVLPGDIHANPENYDADNNFRIDRKPRPSQVPIYKGMKLYLTQNVIKDHDYINGMLCTVEKFTRKGGYDLLRVRTETGRRLTITPWTSRDPKYRKVSFYPIRPGYASTIHKVQGDEFDFIIIWLDIAEMPAAGYTALSRVGKRSHYLIGGSMTEKHFVPANYKKR